MGGGVMPKTVIRVERSDDNVMHVVVGWTKDYDVQLGVTLDPDKHDEADGRFVTLDRGHINRLISDLRIARDHAYGRDQ
jgi:hypothetical protein